LRVTSRRVAQRKSIRWWRLDTSRLFGLVLGLWSLVFELLGLAVSFTPWLQPGGSARLRSP
jgi:hypothetical protein